MGSGNKVQIMKNYSILNPMSALLRRYIRSAISESAEPRRYWGRGGAGIVFICPERNTILLGKRAAWVLDPGTWGSPGGAVDGEFHTTPISDPITDESIFRDTALRETEEECGSLPSGLTLSGRTEFEDEGFRYVTYLARLNPQQVDRWKLNSPDGETDEWRWFPLDDLPSPVHPKLASALRRLGV